MTPRCLGTPLFWHDTVLERRRLANTMSCTKRCRVNTVSTQDGVVSGRHRVNMGSCQDHTVSKLRRAKTIFPYMTSYQHDFMWTICIVNTTSCQSGVVSNSDVPTRCLVKATPCQRDTVPTRRRVKATPCQYDAVVTRHPVKMPPRQNVDTSKQYRVKTTPCPHGAVPQTVSCQDDAVSTTVW